MAVGWGKAKYNSTNKKAKNIILLGLTGKTHKSKSNKKLHSSLLLQKYSLQKFIK
jgi:hypothetical protein